MQKLVFENSNGVTVDLTDFEKYGITDWSGLSECSMDIQSQQVPFNDGSVFLDALLQDRTLSFTVAVNDGGDLQKRYELKRELISILNPKLGEGYLYYTNDYLSRKIKCIPEVPTFPTKNMDNAGTLKASISFTACNPYWESLEEKSETLKAGEVKTIVNNGDVPAQVEIEILNWGVKNPKIYNLGDENKLRINGTVHSPIQISTKLGDKFVENEKLNFYCSNGGQLKSISANDTNIVIMGNISLNMNYKFDVSQIKMDNDIQAVCYSKEKELFCAIDTSNNSVYLSSDGINWEEKEQALTFSGMSIDYIDFLHKFIVGTYGAVQLSSDGINWTFVDNSNDFSLKSICFSENLIVAVGDYLSPFKKGIAISNDGENWNYINLDVSDSNTSTFNKVIYITHLNKFMALTSDGHLYMSTDGTATEWEVLNVQGSDFSNIAYNKNENKICFLNSNKSLISYNGYDWEEENLNFEIDGRIFDIKYIPSNNNFIAISNKGDIAKSNTGLNWELIRPYKKSPYYDCQYIQDLQGYYGLTNNGLYKSIDGMNWEEVKIFDETATYESYLLYSSTNHTIIVSLNVHKNNRDNVIFYSSNDFINWTKIEYSSSISNRGVCVNELFVLGCREGVLVSSDGINWNYINVHNQKLVNQVCYSEKIGKFIALVHDFTEGGEGQLICISSDGINWNLEFQNIESRYLFNYLTCKENLYIIVGFDYKFAKPACFYSNDLKSWNSSPIDYDYMLSPASITYNDKLKIYIITNSNSCKYILISTDLINWELIDINSVVIVTTLLNINSDIILYSQAFISNSFFEKNNMINYLSSDSDMNFNLDVGENKLLLTYDEGYAEAKITFNEKYIGV